MWRMLQLQFGCMPQCYTYIVYSSLHSVSTLLTFVQVDCIAYTLHSAHCTHLNVGGCIVGLFFSSGKQENCCVKKRFLPFVIRYGKCVCLALAAAAVTLHYAPAVRKYHFCIDRVNFHFRFRCQSGFFPLCRVQNAFNNDSTMMSIDKCIEWNHFVSMNKNPMNRIRNTISIKCICLSFEHVMAINFPGVESIFYRIYFKRNGKCQGTLCIEHLWFAV